jgi:hypothetical protein
MQSVIRLSVICRGASFFCSLKMSQKVKPRNTGRRGKLNTADLHFKVACVEKAQCGLTKLY